MSLPPDSLLTPFPWSVRGNTVVDASGRTVCVVFARNATAHAYWIAEVSKLVDRRNASGNVPDAAEEVDALRDRIGSLSFDLAKLESEVADRDDTIADLEDTVDELRHSLDAMRAAAKTPVNTDG